jgi:hypothetical protein
MRKRVVKPAAPLPCGEVWKIIDTRSFLRLPRALREALVAHFDDCEPCNTLLDSLPEYTLPPVENARLDRVIARDEAAREREEQRARR